MEMITIPVSPGELVDRWSILCIKRNHFLGSEKVENIFREMAGIESAVQKLFSNREVHRLFKRLLETNLRLWDIEDKLRYFEKNKMFGADFVSYARAVYVNNDMRSTLKNEINDLLGSNFREVKSYEEY